MLTGSFLLSFSCLEDCFRIHHDCPWDFRHEWALYSKLVSHFQPSKGISQVSCLGLLARFFIVFKRRCYCENTTKKIQMLL